MSMKDDIDIRLAFDAFSSEEFFKVRDEISDFMAEVMLEECKRARARRRRAVVRDVSRIVAIALFVGALLVDYCIGSSTLVVALLIGCLIAVIVERNAWRCP